MDLIIFTIGCIVIAFVTILWIVWSNSLLKRRETVAGSKEPLRVAGVRTGLEEFKIPEESETFKSPEEESTKLKIPDVQQDLDTRSIATSAGQTTQKTYKIAKEIRVRYSRSLYLNRTIFLNVYIASEGKLRPLTPEESKITQETDSEKLEFEALEETPKVKVELKFAEGDFSSGKTKEIQKLKKDEENEFRFMLKALKAEDCIITVVVSYMKTFEVTDKITETVRISKTTTSSSGKTEETEEQTKLIPKSKTDEEIELKTIQLYVSVKSLFGLNTREIDLIKKASAPVVYSIFLAVTLLAGQLEGDEAIISGFASLLPAFGITALAEYWKKSENSDSSSATTSLIST